MSISRRWPSSSDSRRRPPASASSSESSSSASRSRPRRGPSRRRGAAAAEQSLEELGESPVAELDANAVAEALLLEEVLEVARARGLFGVAPLRAETVVALALLGIREHLVGLAQLLEAVLRVPLAIEIGVVLARELAVRPADLVLARAAGNAENLVVVLVLDCHQYTFTRRLVRPAALSFPERAAGLERPLAAAAGRAQYAANGTRDDPPAARH